MRGDVLGMGVGAVLVSSALSWFIAQGAAGKREGALELRLTTLESELTETLREEFRAGIRERTDPLHQVLQRHTEGLAGIDERLAALQEQLESTRAAAAELAALREETEGLRRRGEASDAEIREALDGIRERLDSIGRTGGEPGGEAPRIRFRLERMSKYDGHPLIREIDEGIEEACERSLREIEAKLGIALPPGAQLDLVIREMGGLLDLPKFRGAPMVTSTNWGTTPPHHAVTLHVELFVNGRADLDTELTHELTHAVMRIRMGRIYSRLPKWVREGLALYAADQARDRVATLLMMRHRLDPAQILNGLERSPADRHTFDDYAEDVLAVLAIADIGGEDAIRAWVARMDGGTPYDRALEETLRLDWPTFTQRARAFSLRQGAEWMPAGVDAYRPAYEAYRRRQYDEAAAGFVRFQETHPESPLCVWAAFLGGKSLEALDRWEDADAAYEETIRLGHHLTVGDDAALHRAVMRFKRGDHAAAEEYLEIYLRDYPDAGGRSQGIYYLAEVYAATGRADEARRLLAGFERAYGAQDDWLPRARALLQRLQ